MHLETTGNSLQEFKYRARFIETTNKEQIENRLCDQKANLQNLISLSDDKKSVSEEKGSVKKAWYKFVQGKSFIPPFC